MLVRFQSKERTPGGSKIGIKETRKSIVIGVVFHINLKDNFTTKVKNKFEIL